jgi:SAM-dependent methyltransferase
MNPYRQRIWPILRDLLAPLAPFPRALDFGSGDGWILQQVRASGLAGEVVGVDVQARDNVFAPAQLYDGKRLPFPDRSFDLAYAVDVLHHCPDPVEALRDVQRCTGRCLLLKDHTYRTPAGKLALAVMDELGNRRFGVPSVYRYQRRWDWLAVIEGEGFRRVRLVHPAPVHVGLTGRLTNGLQFIGLWERA